MTCRLSFLLFMIACHGCYYSPWESLEYVAIGSPKSHAQAEVALAGGIPEQRYVAEESSIPSDRFAAFKIEEVMYSVMLLPTGCFHEEKGPYTIWMSAAELRKIKAIDKIKTVKVRSIVVKTSNDEELWRNGSFCLKLNRPSVVNSKYLTYGEFKIMLPDVLNPKDGKDLKIDVSIECNGGYEKTIGFYFRPKVSSGKFQTIN